MAEANKVTVTSLSGYERKSDTLAVVGFAPPSRSKAPYNDTTKDLAGMNEEYAFKWFKAKPANTAAWFQLHPFSSFSRKDNLNDKNHWAWLQKKHPFPILMAENFSQVPSCMRYPREEVFAEFGNYFTSSLTYVMAWAYLVGYKRIELYGFNMASHTEYVSQRPNAHYWIGLLRGKGMEVYTHPESKLMQGYARYAYDDLTLGIRQDLEGARRGYEISLEEFAEKSNRAQGRLNAIMDAVQVYPELTSKVEEYKRNATLVRDDFHIKKGYIRGLRATERAVDKFVGMQRSENVE